MARYIDADDLKRVVEANDWSNPVVPDVVGVIIDRSPTADVVEVVRCKDCVYYKPYAKPVEDFDGRCTARRGETDDDEFCNRGNRRKQT